MIEPDYDCRDEARDMRRADEDADYERPAPRWSGCHEYPGCGADDCPTCRPGCNQSSESESPDESETPADTIAQLESELDNTRAYCVKVMQENMDLKNRHSDSELVECLGNLMLAATSANLWLVQLSTKPLPSATAGLLTCDMASLSLNIERAKTILAARPNLKSSPPLAPLISGSAATEPETKAARPTNNCNSEKV